MERIRVTACSSLRNPMFWLYGFLNLTAWQYSMRSPSHEFARPGRLDPDLVSVQTYAGFTKNLGTFACGLTDLLKCEFLHPK